MEPSASLEAEPSKVTAYGATPPEPELPMAAVGRTFGGTVAVIVLIEMSLSPSLSVTVSLAL